MASPEKATQIDERVRQQGLSWMDKAMKDCAPDICRGGKHILACLIFPSPNMVPSRFFGAYSISAVAAILYIGGNTPLGVGSEPISIDQRISRHLKNGSGDYLMCQLYLCRCARLNARCRKRCFYEAVACYLCTNLKYASKTVLARIIASYLALSRRKKITRQSKIHRWNRL